MGVKKSKQREHGRGGGEVVERWWRVAIKLNEPP
jgi:hypothetical protein